MMEQTISLLDFFILGGPVMWPLVLFSVLTITIVLERLIFFMTHNLSSADLADELCSIMEKEGLEKAVEQINKVSDRKLCKKAFLAILEAKNLAAGEKKSTAVASEAVAQTTRFVNFLSALGTISPITGFLGTVTGMISAFMSISQADNISARLAANGIFQALITTAFGLIIAVVAVVFTHIFNGLSDQFAFSLEGSCNLLLASRQYED